MVANAQNIFMEHNFLLVLANKIGGYCYKYDCVCARIIQRHDFLTGVKMKLN